ncbi:alpha-amylase family glycosyl hydrolase [Alteribacter keqinensis]|uniref:Sucrose phosphorylase n=1 Tax=Alteribacter keqinensis TaxID=2483800 RepID=A0A3M7TSE4_9BACI|nr:alpha-amylase family glycosyl hydrolase [Alteribacter keqinensis]RNA67910.1 alpha-amylase [Alteribacter keqinensis]
MDKQTLLSQIEEKLRFIYGDEYEKSYMEGMKDLVSSWESRNFEQPRPISERNVYMITYGDSFYENGRPTLETLHKFLKNNIGETITDVHLLPMFPYTSDDGFSVTDYREINPELGNWEHIEALSEDYRLMFDFVANHISKSSEWFKGYLNDDPKYRGYFIPKDDSFDTSRVVRPRTSHLYHEYEGKDGTKTAWTTFSEDQVDVNVRHFPVLLELTDILLEYAQKGGTSIRLDAIGFLWKRSGTTSIHLPETHAIIELWHLVLDYFKEGTQIITETNVPHKENISYFGDGENEAHMVYQFSLPPLMLYTLTTHDSTKMTEWAKTIGKVSDEATYFNFLASHDGIGMRPTEGILSEEDKQMLVDKVRENGGRVSYKSNPDGSESVYELNINYSEALVNKGDGESDEEAVKKSLAAHSVLTSFMGVPAIYYHSLLGSKNDYAGLEASGINRRINREKLEYERIADELNTDAYRKSIYEGMQELVRIRRNESAFSPYADQQVLDLGASVFALKRTNTETGNTVYAVVNVTNEHVSVDLPEAGTDLFTGERTGKAVTLAPYQYIWVKK